MKTIKRLFLKKDRDETKLRTISLPCEENQYTFCDNRIKTSRYNFFTFLPLFLFDQFKKATNLYFLFVSLLQQIPQVSPIGKYISLSSLLIILGIIAIKEIFEDIKRHLSDSRINNLMCEVYRCKWKTTTWGKICVGDIIRVFSGQTVPADMLLLATSEDNHTCYIHTSSLDGETSCKIKHCRKECLDYSCEKDWNTKHVTIQCDSPNKKLYNFNGLMKIGNHENFSLTNEQVVLRGCQVKNTCWIVGVVLYTGKETKLKLNSSKTVIKRSTVDLQVNYLVFALFMFLGSLVIISTLFFYINIRSISANHHYMKISDLGISVLRSILTFFILYHNMIPLSLLATVEIVKVFQAYLIGSDTKMYTVVPTVHNIVNTSTIIEDLGQVNYIFTDKTGTLTCNEMILKELSIGLQRYVLDDNLQKYFDPQSRSDNDTTFKLFCINLLLCNNVVVDKNQDQQDIFQSSSPDEAAIVPGLMRIGFKFLKRTNDGIHIEYFGRMEFWKILLTLEFTSERQRMSVFTASPDNEYFLFTKGADNAIFSRLKLHDDRIISNTNTNLENFAKKGLRTLCIAYKQMRQYEMENLMMNYNIALSSLTNREMAMDSIAEDIERDLILLGCTGIEDKLQNNVCNTIYTLRQARINIWMLTGDKIETAINVAYASGVLSDNMQLYILACKDIVDCQIKLANIITENNIIPFIDKKIKKTKHSMEIALVLTGQDLQYALSNECSIWLLNVAVYCKTVICCRISPSQKKEVVVLVKNSVEGAVTLAIGDGANDCSMIRASHIGIGIVGKEGLHAANTADFSIDEFQLLSNLLFVHGASAYRNICNCIYFVFYKNLIINLLSFFYNFITKFSGNSIIHKVHFSLFNNLYTILHPFCFGVLDKASSYGASVNVPYLYRSVQKNYKFNLKRFTYWCLNGFVHAFLIFMLGYYALNNGTIDTYGNLISESIFEVFILTVTLLVICFKSLLEIRNWSSIIQLFVWSGFVSFILMVILMSRHFYSKSGPDSVLLDIDAILIMSPMFYIGIFIAFIILLPDFVFHAVRNTWFIPSHQFITNLEKTSNIDWSVSTLVGRVKNDLEVSKRSKVVRFKKYFGFAFSVNEERHYSKNV